jgi:Tol biopolymer transport system component
MSAHSKGQNNQEPNKKGSNYFGRKSKKNINFQVRERIVPGSFLAVIPFAAEAISGMMEQHFEEVPHFFFPVEEDQTFPILDLHSSAITKQAAPELGIAPPAIEAGPLTPLQEVRESNPFPLPSLLPPRESANMPLNWPGIQPIPVERVTPELPTFQRAAQEEEEIVQQLVGGEDDGIEPPEANLDVESIVPQDTPVIFDATGSFDLDGQIVTYDFDFGNGATYSESVGNAPDGVFDGMTSYTYDTPGQYKATLTVTDDTGLTDTEFQFVRAVNSLPVFLSPGDTAPTIAGFENPDLADSTNTADKSGTVPIEGSLDAVKNNPADPNTLVNVVEPTKAFTAIANAYDPDGTVKGFDFYVDLNKDNDYNDKNEYLGFSNSGEINVDGAWAGFSQLQEGLTYKMQVKATDDDGGFAYSYSNFRVNNAPIFLNPGDNPLKTPGVVDNTLLGDPAHSTDNPLTPYVEGKLDAVKNDGTTEALNNIVQEGNSWTARANAYDTDGSIKGYDFWIDVNQDKSYDLSEYVGNSKTGEILIDGSFGGFGSLTSGNIYDMKVVVTDNNGATAESTDQFTVNNAPIFLNPGDDPNVTPNDVDDPDYLPATDPDLSTPWVEGGLDAVENNLADPNTLNNVVLQGNTWLAKANAYDTDGTIDKYEFWIDVDKDGNYEAGEFLGVDTDGQILVTGATFTTLAAGDYNMKVTVTDNTGATASSIDKFTVNSAPVILNPGDDPTKTPNVVDDPNYNTPPVGDPTPGTPYVEGSLDAVKNDLGDPFTLSNIVYEGNSWTAKANALDTDGSIVSYDFFIDSDDNGIFEYVGSSVSGEILIDSGFAGFATLKAGNLYDMKVIVTDNAGATAESIDDFYVTNYADGGMDAVSPPIDYDPGVDGLYGTSDDVFDVDVINQGSNLNFAIAINNTTSEPDGIKEYQYRINGGSWVTGFTVADPFSNASITSTVSSLTTAINGLGATLAPTTSLSSPHVLEVKVIDGIGQETVLTDEIIVKAAATGAIDAVSPPITVDTDTISLGSNLAFGINVTDPNGIKGYEYTITDSETKSITSGTAATMLDLITAINALGPSLSSTTDPLNPHLLEVLVEDNLGDKTLFTDNIIVNAPTTASMDAVATNDADIKADTDQITQGSNLNFQLQASDANGIAGYQYKVIDSVTDDTGWSTVFATEGSLTTSINLEGPGLSVTTNPLNPHQLQVKVIDTLGNETVLTDNIIVDAAATGGIDVDAPPITVDNDTFNVGDTLAFKQNITDSNGIAKYEYSINGESFITASSAANLETLINARGPALAAGSYTLDVKITDTLGNESTFTDTFDMVATGNVFPTVTMDAVKDSADPMTTVNVIQPGATWTIDASATDPDGTIIGYKFYIDLDQNSTFETYLGSSGDGQFVADAAALGLKAGEEYEVFVIAQDDAGGADFTTDTFKVNAPPTGTLDADTATSPNLVPPSTNWTAQATGTDADGTVAQYDFWIDLNRDGDYNDALENIGSSLTGTINITNDLNQLGLVKGLSYNMKTVLTDNYGLTSGDIFDTFSYGTNSPPVALGDSNANSVVAFSGEIPFGQYGTVDQLFVYDIGQGTLQNVSKADSFVFAEQVEKAEWAANGSGAIFVGRDKDAFNSVFFAKADGTGVINLSDGFDSIYPDSWDISADGQYVSFVNQDGFGENQLVIAKTDGSDIQIFSNSSTSQDFASLDSASLEWSPIVGDNSLAYWKDNNIFTINPLGAETNLTGSLTPSFNVYFQWSPDGDQIAYYTGDLNDIWVVNSDGSGSPTNLTNTPLIEDVGRLIWSPDGDYLAFSVNDAFSFDLYTVASDGLSSPNLIQLNAGVYGDDRLGWSADSTKIVYSSADDLYISNFDGTGQTQLTFTLDLPEVETRPIFSPDGSRVYFASGSGGLPDELYSITTDGSNVITQLTNTPTSIVNYFGLSPDGKQIAYYNSFDQIVEVINADGSSVTPKQIKTDTFIGVDNYSFWSPTENKIITGTTDLIDASSTDDVSIYDADLDSFTKLTITSASSALGPVVNPAGDLIAYYSNEGSGSLNQVFILDPSSNAATQLSNLAFGVDTGLGLEWSADGQNVAYRDGSGGLYIARADGSTVDVPVTTGFFSSSSEDLQWSPDGQFLLYKDSSGLSVYSVATGSSTLLSSDFSADIDINAWSGDSSRILFTDSLGLNTVFRDGSGLNLIKSFSPGFETTQQWSPDGTKVLFTVDNGFGAVDDLRIIGADGSGETLLSSSVDEGLQYYMTPGVPFFSFSPDSSQVLFTSGDSFSVPGDVFVINSDGTGLINLTNSPTLSEYDAQWSPDGSQIIYLSGSSFSSSDIFVTDNTGSGTLNLTNSPAFYQNLTWSPGNDAVIYRFDGDLDSYIDIYILGTDGISSPVEVTNYSSNIENINDFKLNTSTLSQSVYADGSTILDILKNDIDPDGDPLDITEINGSSITYGTPIALTYGNLTVNSDDTVTYEAFNTSSSKAEIFTYTITDPYGASSTATVTINILGLNTNPNLVDDNLATTEDTKLSFNVSEVLANDTDAEGADLTILSYDATSNYGGKVVLSPNGKVFTYTLDEDFNNNGPNGSNALGGTIQDYFTYTVSDGAGGTSTATIFIDVSPTNDAPVSYDDYDSTMLYSDAAGIYWANSDGSGTPTLIPGTAGGSGAVWSPDGNQVAFIASDGDIVVINKDGSGLTTIADVLSLGINYSYKQNDGGGTPWYDGIDTSYPEFSDLAWSPDGTRIAYSQSYGYSTVRNFVVSDSYDLDSVGVRDASTGSVVPGGIFSALRSTSYSDPAWSPDGSGLFYNYSFENWWGGTTVNEIRTTGGIFGALDTGIELDSHPIFSYDGTRAAFLGSDGVNQYLYFSNSDGSSENIVVGSSFLGTAEIVSWLPNGQEVLLDDGRAVNVNTGVFRDAFPEPTGTGFGVSDVRVAPIFVAQSTPTVLNVLSGDFDPDSGDTITIISVSSPNATITGGGTEITFNSGSTGLQSFTYTIEDVDGLQSTSTVSVYVF